MSCIASENLNGPVLLHHNVRADNKISKVMCRNHLHDMIHLQCVHCNRLPLPSDRCGQHLKRYHTVASISCRSCAQLFVYQSDADKHLMTHCSRECPMCAQKMSVRLMNFIFINFTIILIIITAIVRMS